ncbi:hypothetical protein ABW21_db0203742 [Orbilia brochopaga]|nr:hypothetical protein ABW21_db0203742 [Drechslerella brochopaga]
MDSRSASGRAHQQVPSQNHVSRPAAASASTTTAATSAPTSAPVSTPVVPSSTSSTITPGLPDSPRRNSKLRLHTGPRTSSGSRSLQNQLSHLYQHHQHHSSHSPYIDFQNVLLSQASGLGSGSNGRVNSINSHFHLFHPVFSPVSPMNVLASDVPSSTGPFMQGSPRLGPAAAAPAPGQTAGSPAGPLQSNSGTVKEDALAASPRPSQGISLDPARMRLESHSSSQSEKQQQAAQKPPERTQPGPAPPVLPTPVNGVIMNKTAAKKRRDSLTSAPLHLDMEMQVDSGYGGDELLGRMITDFVHADDSHIFIRDFNEAIASNQQLCLFFRFRRKDESYVIFESNGHPHFSDQRQMPINTTTPVCSGFFMMARLYPTKNTALLDSFLEHKIENERLKRRIAELRCEEYEDQQAQLRAREALQSKGNTTGNADPKNRLQVPTSAPRSISVPVSLTERLEGSATADSVRQANSKSMPPPAISSVSHPPGQLTRQNLEGLNNTGLRPDSLRDKMARYEGVTHADTIEMLTGLRYNEGERSRGISTGHTSPSLIRGDVGVPMSVDRDSRGSGERKKKIKVTNEYVCTDCGTLDSPEWRKGPTGPKT